MLKAEYIYDCSGLRVLNTCPHGLNLIDEKCTFQNRKPGKTGIYELRQEFYGNLASATFCFIPRTSFVLSVNPVMPTAWESGIADDRIPFYDANVGIADFNRDIPEPESNEADIIVVSEQCATLLLSKIFCLQAGISIAPSILKGLNGFGYGINSEGEAYTRTPADVLLFADRFYVPKNRVYRDGKVVGTLGLQKVTPYLSEQIFVQAIQCRPPHPYSRLGLNRAGRCAYARTFVSSGNPYLDAQIKESYRLFVRTLQEHKIPMTFPVLPNEGPSGEDPSGGISMRG